MKKIIYLFGLSLLAIQPLKANWDPATFVEEQGQGDAGILTDGGYLNLKKRVLDQLVGSWCSAEKANLLMDLVMLTKPDVCVEVGVFTGSSLLPIAATLQHHNRGHIYAVDAWTNTVATQYMEFDDPNRNWWSSVSMDNVFRIFNKMLDDWYLRSYCTILQKNSPEAAAVIPSIDFLHLDGDYTESGAFSDVKNFLPKVKPGGYILFSNFFTMVKGKQPKVKAFCALFDECDMVCDIERENAILFRKR